MSTRRLIASMFLWLVCAVNVAAVGFAVRERWVGHAIGHAAVAAGLGLWAFRTSSRGRR